MYIKSILYVIYVCVHVVSACMCVYMHVCMRQAFHFSHSHSNSLNPLNVAYKPEI